MVYGIMALEIQSAFNQMLSSAGILGGIYAHMPEVAKERERKQKLQEISEEKKIVGEQKEEVDYELNKMGEKFVETVENSNLTEEEKEEAYRVRTSLEKQSQDLGKKQETLSKQEEQYNPKLRIEKTIERSKKAKETTLKALQSYAEGQITLEEFQQKVGVKEKKVKNNNNKKRGHKK